MPYNPLASLRSASVDCAGTAVRHRFRQGVFLCFGYKVMELIATEDGGHRRSGSFRECTEGRLLHQGVAREECWLG